MDTYNIDSHKLYLHPIRVAKWINGENIYPLYVEFSPSGMCNHRCRFCTMDFMGYRSINIKPEVYAKRIHEMGHLGIKAVMFAGEGEPLLNKNIASMAEETKQAGIDLSVTTNAIFLKKELSQRLLPVSSWIKVSCNAGTPDTYAKIHGTKADDFNRLMRNLKDAVSIKAKQKIACTLGAQCILLPENKNEVVGLARLIREMGMDYLVIKPYTHHPQSNGNIYGKIDYEQYGRLADELADESRNGFRVIYRQKTMSRWNEKNARFRNCLALPFWAYVDAESRVWGCSRHLGQDAFFYGDLCTHSFKDIWQAERRKKGLQWCQEKLDIKQCHVTCRMEVVNNYLWRLRHPEPHDNFI